MRNSRRSPDRWAESAPPGSFRVNRGGLISESNGRFSKCPKNVPKTIITSNGNIEFETHLYCKVKENIVLKFNSKMQIILIKLNE